MAKDFTPLISVEKMAAYLDSNLPEEEMQSIQSSIEEDVNMGTFFNEVSIVDNGLEEISLGQTPLELDLSDSWILPDPQDTSIDIDLSVMDELFSHGSNFACNDLDDLSMNNQNNEEY